MNIDREKLPIGIWYEDRAGNMYKFDGIPTEESCQKLYGISLYDLREKTCFPLQITERTSYPGQKDCKHPRKFVRRTGGWVKGIKGCYCDACGCEKVGKDYIPFAFMKWKDSGATFLDSKGFASNTYLSKGAGKTIVAMVNSGDFELDEAMVVYAHACERCMNVLDHKYLGGDEGYEEFSDQWKLANTKCSFCDGIYKGV
jgi:hypothetical protein